MIQSKSFNYLYLLKRKMLHWVILTNLYKICTCILINRVSKSELIIHFIILVNNNRKDL